MNTEEIQSLVEQLKAKGLKEDDIMDVFYETFTQGKMDRKDLETLANFMGYDLTDEFKEDNTPDPIESSDAEKLSEDELENTKQLGEKETSEDFKERIDEVKESSENDDEEEDEEDEEEWNNAKKNLFKL